MAIKLSIDLSDATFAELSAVIGYAHQLGVDPDEKLNVEGNVINIEFDGDLHFDDVFDAFDDAEIELDHPREDGPIYAEDLIDDENMDDRRHQSSRNFDDELVNDIKDGVNTVVNGVMDVLSGSGRFGEAGSGFNRGNNFGGPRGNGFLGPFGPFGPNNRGPRF